MLASPLIAFLLLLVLFPAVYGFVTSFQNRTILSPTIDFAGLANYWTVLKDSGFRSAMWFTLRFTVAVTTIQLVLGFLLALLFNKAFPGKRIFLSVLLLPIMVAPALMGIMFRLMLNENIGTVPYFLSFLGFQVNLFDPDVVVPLLIVLDVVQWTPFTFLILYAGLQNVPGDLYEAAAVDGASYWRTVWSVVVPLLAPIFFIAAFLRGIDAFRTFDVIYVLTGGGPGTTTTTASIYIYKLGFEQGNIGLSAAASFLVVVLLLPILPFVIKRIVRGSGAR